MFVLLQVVQIVLWYLDSGCSRHMTGDRSKLINYVEKLIGTVRFENDQFAKIIGIKLSVLKNLGESNQSVGLFWVLVAPTERYGEAIVIPETLMENFEIKTNLLQDVPNDAIMLMLFPYSLEGAARICFKDALLLMPKFASTIKSLLANKDKLFELAKVSLNENCSAVLLKKLPVKLEDSVNMASLADKAISLGADNRPPMLEKDMYDSWKSRMELYMLNR
nr:reverse transcriptase domain-containing protein [Tanacetum cinerariifolium]